MRSGVGTFCPLSRRPDLLEVLFPCALPPALDDVAAFCGASLFGLAWLFVLAVPVLLLIVRRNFARQVECPDPVAVLPAENLEYHIIAMLELCDRLAVVGNKIGRAHL